MRSTFLFCNEQAQRQQNAFATTGTTGSRLRSPLHVQTLGDRQRNPKKNTRMPPPAGPIQSRIPRLPPAPQRQPKAAALLPVDATHVAAVPSTPATAVEPPAAASPTGVWPATGLRRRVCCTARLRLFPTRAEHTSALTQARHARIFSGPPRHGRARGRRLFLARSA